MDEFAQSRFRLEARYHHVLVDEFQDTSRAQWELVAQLVQELGRRLRRARRRAPAVDLHRRRPEAVDLRLPRRGRRGGRRGRALHRGPAAGRRRRGRRSRSASDRCRRSWRSSTRCSRRSSPARPPAARSGRVPLSTNRRSVSPTPRADPRTRRPNAVEPCRAPYRSSPPKASRPRPAGCRRDRASPGRNDSCAIGRPASPRGARPADIAILFRSRDSHRDSRRRSKRAACSTYVYKGLGFFDADEIQDAVALLRYLADPLSDLRAAAFLRSRLVRLSDRAVARLGRTIAAAIIAGSDAGCPPSADEDRRVLERLRALGRRVAVVGRSPDAVGAARRGAATKRRTPTRSAGRGAGRRGRT